MAADMRFGLELEFHAINLTMREHGTDNYWVKATGGVNQEDTMIAVEPILVPVNQATFSPHPPNILWESDWGFRAVGDAHGDFVMRPDGHPARDVGYCILELATAANRVGDAAYWINSRICSKEFLATINQYRPNTINDPHQVTDGTRRWYPLQSFLDAYNARLDHLPDRPGFTTAAEKNKFKLQKSAQVGAFEAGTAAVAGHWDFYISGTNEDSKLWVDVQLTYQISLRTLYDSTEQWISAWASMWAWMLSGQLISPSSPTGLIDRPALDPNIGDVRLTSLSDMYRVQIYAAMWRTAKAYVDDPSSFRTAFQGLNANTSLIKGLIMYLLVCGSITPEVVAKNAYPHLPKTSPASIAHAIGNMGPAEQASCARLANINDAEVIAAKDFCLNIIRNKAKLMLPPGNLPKTGPQPSDSPFSHEDIGMLKTFPTSFLRTWTGAFNLANPVNAANQFGFVTTPPFECLWARDVNTTVPATAFATPGAPAPNDVKMALESRFSRTIMNYGFDPYTRDFMFNRSYMSLVKLLAAPALVLPAQHDIDAVYPDEPRVVQNFKNGPH